MKTYPQPAPLAAINLVRHCGYATTELTWTEWFRACSELRVRWWHPSINYDTSNIALGDSVLHSIAFRDNKEQIMQQARIDGCAAQAINGLYYLELAIRGFSVKNKTPQTP